MCVYHILNLSDCPLVFHLNINCISLLHQLVVFLELVTLQIFVFLMAIMERQNEG